MDYDTLTIFHSDSHMARHEGFGEGCPESGSSAITTSPHSPTSSCPAAFRPNETQVRPKSPAYSVSTLLPLFSDHTNTSFGDIFTAVLGSKLAKRSTSKITHVPSPPHAEPSLEKPKDVFKKETPITSIQGPSSFVCRVREDRERQLNTRCLRIIRKLYFYPEYQEIVRRFASAENEVDTEALMSSCANKARIRCSCGVRAYLMKFLCLIEPKQSSLTESQTTLLMSGDSPPEHIYARDTIGSPNKYDTRRMSRNSITHEQFSELEEKERSVKMPNGSSVSGALATKGKEHLSPETLLRRLARSISTRITYKRCLLEEATRRLSKLDKETDGVRSLLLKVTGAPPPGDVCHFPIPLAITPTTEVVGMKTCQLTPASSLMPPTSPTWNPNLSTAVMAMAPHEATMNLLPRFDRLLSSQIAVLELLCQLTRRLYCLDRRIAEVIVAGAEDTACVGHERDSCELDATLFPLQSRRQQLMEQIREAQRLRDDFESTKVRLLSGLQHQVLILRGTKANQGEDKSGGVSSSPSEDIIEACQSGGHSSPFHPHQSELDSTVCLAELVSRHLVKYLQALLIKLSLETEIFDDQEAVDCVGEHLRLVASFSP